MGDHIRGDGLPGAEMTRAGGLVPMWLSTPLALEYNVSTNSVARMGRSASRTSYHKQ